MEIPKIACRKCGGTGQVPDPAELAKALRELRKKAGMSLMEMSGELGISIAFLSDLERNRRNLTIEMVNRIVDVVEKRMKQEIVS